MSLLWFVVWRFRYERKIRRESVRQAQAVIAGKVYEQLVPYLPNFPFNPKDARFLGSPVDLVIFDGLDRGELARIVFVEVKTGNSALTARERQIRATVQAGRVEWLELRGG